MPPWWPDFFLPVDPLVTLVLKPFDISRFGRQVRHYESRSRVSESRRARHKSQGFSGFSLKAFFYLLVFFLY